MYEPRDRALHERINAEQAASRSRSDLVTRDLVAHVPGLLIDMTAVHFDGRTSCRPDTHDAAES